MDSSWIGLAAVIGLLFLIAAVVASSKLPAPVKSLICAALAFRVIASLARYKVLFEFYGGGGDARRYYNAGIVYATQFKELDFSALFDSSGWQGGNWYGTQFVKFVSGGVLTVIGTSFFTEFVVFSTLSLVGLLGFAMAFRRSYPYTPWSSYLVWLLFFPSLWFWPSSVGKEAVLILGLGLAVMGFIGRSDRVNWPVMAGGLVIVFAVRPQVAGVFLVCIILAQWLSFHEKWTFGKTVQGVLLLTAGLFGLYYAMQSVGIEEFDVEGVQGYVESDPARRTSGETHVEAVHPGLAGIPLAVVNILFRPFPWEATNSMVLLSSLEILALWAIAFYRRRKLLASLRNWRSNRLLRLSTVFILIYSIALGMMVINFGIIARQRILLFPFLFILFEADVVAVRKGQRLQGVWKTVRGPRPAKIGSSLQ